MEVSGRRVRRFRARFGGDRRGATGGASILPLTSRRHHDDERSGGAVSCCYRDFKIYALNEPLFRLGRRYASFFKVWFSVGLGFGIAALLLVSAVLLLQFHPNSLSDRLTAAFFGLSLSSSLSLSGVAYVFVSSVICVFIHELGHAFAAASEGIRLEYIAIFIAALFPGALVAFDHDVLQTLPRSNVLRVYCAGIWHNAVFCGACAMTLFLLPVILSPFYVHGENPRVLDVPSTSPLFGYLSPGDVIVSMDGVHVHSPIEWLEVAAFLDNYTTQSSNTSFNLESFGKFHHRKGYCVPDSVIQESYEFQTVEKNQFVCPGDLTAFVPIRCLESNSSNDNNVKDGQPNRRAHVFCLNAKDIVKLNKCGDGWVISGTGRNSCVCPQGESCLSAVQTPGLTWTEITYLKASSPTCLKLGIASMDSNTSESDENNCEQSFVFVGNLVSMAHSVRLSAYQPRWAFSFSERLPDMLERSLTCTFHVSLTLVLLNSLPVYFLDGESILEVSLGHFTWLSFRRRKTTLQVCLLGGTVLTIIAFLRIFFISFFWNKGYLNWNKEKMKAYHRFVSVECPKEGANCI